MLVKFRRPVGGALMQCFKAWERTGQPRRKGWEKMLRQTSPSTREKVKQSGDKCRSKLILVALIPTFHHFERCFSSFSVFKKNKHMSAQIDACIRFYISDLAPRILPIVLHDYISGSLGILM